jgi:hypothetical protein
MSWTSSPVVGPIPSAFIVRDSTLSQRAKSTPTHAQSIPATFRRSACMEMFDNSLENFSVEAASALVSLSLAGHVKIYQRAATEVGFAENEADSGPSVRASFARFDPTTLSWRTRQRCLMDGWEKFSGTFPASGIMLNGKLFLRLPLVRHIFANASGLLPTPLASDNRDRGDCSMPSIQRRMTIGKQIGLSMLFKGTPCPSCVEGMMGLPRDYTRLD